MLRSPLRCLTSLKTCLKTKCYDTFELW